MKKSALRFALVVGALLANTVFAVDPNMPATGPGSGQSDFHGIELGVRAGYGIPLGTAGDNTNLSDQIKGIVPLWADLGYRFDPNWYLGAFFQFGFGFVPSNAGAGAVCVPGVSCSVNDLRFGLNVHYHFLPADTFDPWLGVGAGYEILNLSASAPGTSVSASTRGFEFGNVQLGLDFRISPAFAVGPFATFTIAQFSDNSASVNGQDLGAAGYTNKGIHEWVIFGVRGVFDILLD
jgi:hypothetical protein